MAPFSHTIIGFSFCRLFYLCLKKNDYYDYKLCVLQNKFAKKIDIHDQRNVLCVTNTLGVTSRESSSFACHVVVICIQLCELAWTHTNTDSTKTHYVTQTQDTTSAAFTRRDYQLLVKLKL